MTHILKIVAILYAFLYIGSLIPFNLGSLNMFSKGVQDYQATDILYSRFKSTSNFDERIILINSTVPDREKIVSAFKKLEALGAKVIGVDILFEDKKDAIVDSLLIDAIQSNKAIVLADVLDLTSQKTQPHLCNEVFCPSDQIGFINFVAKPNHAIRYFSANEKHLNQNVDAFASAIVKRYDSKSYTYLTNRTGDVEQINFRGDQNSYAQISIDDLLTKNNFKDLFKDKIVLLGYLGSDDWAMSARDKFYTPMNKDIGQKSLPDMYGMVVHANIISMILDKDYIDEINPWISRIINFLLIVALVALMRKFFLQVNPGYFKLMRFVQLGIFFLLFTLLIVLFHFFSLKLNLTSALVGVVLSWDIVKIYQHIILNKQKPLRTKV